MIDPLLATLFGFDDDDLATNRNGMLSAGQRRRQALRFALTQAAVLVLTLVPAGFIVARVLRPATGEVARLVLLALLVLVVAYGLGDTFRKGQVLWVETFRRGKVVGLCGRISLIVDRKLTTRQWWLLVDPAGQEAAQRFSVPDGIQPELFDPKCDYCVYYLPESREIVSLARAGR